MTRSQRVQQRTVALVEKQDAVNVVGLAQIGRQAHPEGAHIRMKEAERAGPAPLQIHLGDLCDARHIGAENIFDGAE